MKINPIKTVKSLYYANRPLKLAKENPLIKLSPELDDYMYNNITDYYKTIRHYTKKLNKPFTAVPKGESSTLINFGPFTTLLENSSNKNSIRNSLENIIIKTIAANRC